MNWELQIDPHLNAEGNLSTEMTMHHLPNTDTNLRCSSLPISPVLEMSPIFGSLTETAGRADIVMPDQSASERFHGDALVHLLEQKIPEHI